MEKVLILFIYQPLPSIPDLSHRLGTEKYIIECYSNLLPSHTLPKSYNDNLDLRSVSTLIKVKVFFSVELTSRALITPGPAMGDSR